MSVMDRIGDRSEIAAWLVLIVAVPVCAILNVARGKPMFPRYTPFK